MSTSKRPPETSKSAKPAAKLASKTAAEAAILKEARGSLVTVDRALFFTVLEYLAEKQLNEKLSEYLADQGHSEIILDVGTANALKRFLVKERRTDTKARMIIACSCGGGGGGGGGGGVVAGVRG